MRGIVFLVDCRRDPNPEDMDIIQVLRSKNLPVVLVATKIDKLKSSAEFANSLNALEDRARRSRSSSRRRRARAGPRARARVNSCSFPEDAEEEEVEWVLDVDEGPLEAAHGPSDGPCRFRTTTGCVF